MPTKSAAMAPSMFNGSCLFFYLLSVLLVYRKLFCIWVGAMLAFFAMLNRATDRGSDSLYTL